MVFTVIRIKKINGKTRFKTLRAGGGLTAFSTKKEAEFAKKVVRKQRKKELKGVRLKIKKI